MNHSHTARQAERRHWRRRGSSWLALLLLTFRPGRPPERRDPFDRRARVAGLDFNLLQ